MNQASPPRVLLTGASGYVGGRLLAALEGAGVRVRCLARQPRYLEPRVAPDTEVVAGDVLEPETLARAMAGIRTAYYLIHSMSSPGAFQEQDRQAAGHFAASAREAGVERIVYLGGLGRGEDLSPHLASRQEVGRILRDSGVPTVELRASIIIGSGSLSFEMVRNLVERLPVMVAPRWVRITTQPIAVEDVIEYLMQARQIPLSGSEVLEIGGSDRVSYLELMREYASQRGLRRLILPVPVLTPRLSSLWLGLVTPVYARVGRSLIDSLRHETVVTDGAALRRFPLQPRGVREAIHRALRNEDRDFAHTRWSDALSSGRGVRHWGGRRFGARLLDSRSIPVSCEPAQAFAPIRRIGGATGWYFGNWLWRTRGFLDLLVGGVGMRRGRRSPGNVRPGDTVDFWRVEEVRSDRLLRLYAEMKLPGRAWLQFEVDPTEAGSVVRQTAIFDPLGLAGLLYWYALYPIHHVIFGRMLRNLAAAGEAGRQAAGRPMRAEEDPS